MIGLSFLYPGSRLSRRHLLNNFDSALCLNTLSLIMCSIQNPIMLFEGTLRGFTCHFFCSSFIRCKREEKQFSASHVPGGERQGVRIDRFYFLWSLILEYLIDYWLVGRSSVYLVKSGNQSVSLSVHWRQLASLNAVSSHAVLSGLLLNPAIK